MKKQGIFFLILAMAAVSGCMDDSGPKENNSATPTPVPVITQAFPVPEPSTVYVEIKGTAFYPLELNITNGTTVRWTNKDSAPYVINVSGFESPPLNKYNTWNFTFNKSGIYDYSCSLHPSMKHGRVYVE